MHALSADGRSAPVARQPQPDRPDAVPRYRGALRPAAGVDGDADHPARPRPTVAFRGDPLDE
jgi:hypothetical protein